MRISDWSSDVCSSDLVADPTLGMEHEDADMLAPRHRLDRRRAGIARCRADDRDVGPAAREEGLEKLAEQLQRDVLERQRRPVEQLQQPVAMVELRSEEHTSELPSLMRISSAVLCLKNKHKQHEQPQQP